MLDNNMDALTDTTRLRHNGLAIPYHDSIDSPAEAFQPSDRTLGLILLVQKLWHRPARYRPLTGSMTDSVI